MREPLSEREEILLRKIENAWGIEDSDRDQWRSTSWYNFVMQEQIPSQSFLQILASVLYPACNPDVVNWQQEGF